MRSPLPTLRPLQGCVFSGFPRSNLHTTARRFATPHDSHYETLNLSHTATPTEIKKRFYELSKAHHPDRNRNDPAASKRFVKISSAYSVLGDVKSREQYDRELHRSLSSRSGSTHGHARHGPVGARPASGLSRRKTQFKGPPPSFFKNGGWATFRGTPHHSGSKSTSGVNSGGFGVGGFTTGRNDDVPHFDFGEKQRMHEKQARRWSARASGGQHPGFDPGLVFPVVTVTAILLITVSTGALVDSESKAKSKRH